MHELVHEIDIAAVLVRFKQYMTNKITVFSSLVIGNSASDRPIEERQRRSPLFVLVVHAQIS